MFKVLEISCLHNDKLTCLERPIAIVLNWLNIDYRYIFLSGWSFSYNYMEDYKGIKSVPELNAFLENSKKFAGVCFDVRNLPVSVRINQIYNNIIMWEKPIIIYIDSYWCPWYPSYQKSHVHHYILVIGIDTHKKYFICIDKDQEKVLLPYEDYIKGSGEIILMTDVNKNNKCNKRILKNECYSALDPESIQHNIHKFACDVRYDMNVSKQLENYHDSRVAPLYTWLKGISYDRLNYAEFIEILLEKNRYDYFRSELEKISFTWRDIIILLIKAGIRKNNEKAYERIANRIDQIAKKENEIMEQFKEHLYE